MAKFGELKLAAGNGSNSIILLLPYASRSTIFLSHVINSICCAELSFARTRLEIGISLSTCVALALALTSSQKTLFNIISIAYRVSGNRIVALCVCWSAHDVHTNNADTAHRRRMRPLGVWQDTAAAKFPLAVCAVVDVDNILCRFMRIAKLTYTHTQTPSTHSPTRESRRWFYTFKSCPRRAQDEDAEVDDKPPQDARFLRTMHTILCVLVCSCLCENVRVFESPCSVFRLNLLAIFAY